MSKHLKILIIILITTIVFFVIKLFAFDFFIIEEISMYKTVLNDDKVVISKYSRNKVGDIILYEDKNSTETKISRLVAMKGNIVKIKGQNLYVDNQPVKYKDVVYSYCFRFISENEEDSLRHLYLISKINNSGFFQAELTDKEHENILNDTLSDLNKKLVPIEDCCCHIFSETEPDFEITVPPDSVFILNDNRSDLYDSRTFGLIPIDKIIGKIIYVY